MNATPYDLERALDEVTASSAGGAPFLIAFGLSLAICGGLGFVLPLKVAAIVVLFQGNLALPLALWLERRLGTARMSRDNPLRALSIQMAMSQIVALPAAFIAYSYHPATVPAALAAIAGGHFLPYAWLQRTKLYVFVGVAVSVGAFALTVALGKSAFPWVLFYMSAIYGAAAVPLLAHARRLAPRGGGIT